MKACFASAATILISISVISEAAADYPPYRYTPSGQNRVLLIERESSASSGSHGHHFDLGFGHGYARHCQSACGSACGGQGQRMEYAPYRYTPVRGTVKPPTGLAGDVHRGQLREHRFIDLQPRYQYGATNP